MGKPIKESLAEVEKCAWALNYFASNAKEMLEDQIIKTEASKKLRSVRAPRNHLYHNALEFSFWQVIRCAAPALAAGNVIILKHSSYVQGVAWSWNVPSKKQVCLNILSNPSLPILQ